MSEYKEPMELDEAYKLADALYAAGYKDRHNERDYDPRKCPEWQAVVDPLIERAAPEAPADDDQAWDREAERLTREMGIGGGKINPNATSVLDLFVDDDAQAAPEAPKTGDKHSKLPWRITDAPRKIVGADGATVANLTALDLPNAELIVASVNRAAPEAPASEQQASGWRDCEDCDGTSRISPNELCNRCNQSGLLPTATTASASDDLNSLISDLPGYAPDRSGMNMEQCSNGIYILRSDVQEILSRSPAPSQEDA